MAAEATAPDDADFRALRRSLWDRRARLKFKTNPVAPFFEAMYHGRRGTAAIFVAVLPIFYLTLFSGILFALAAIAYWMPVLAPVVQFIVDGRKILVGIFLGICVLVYWAWRRHAVMASVLVWDCVWRAGALTLTSRSDGAICESPTGDWRAFAKDLAKAAG